MKIQKITEQHEQEVVAKYIDLLYPGILWTASAGGMRVSIGTIMKMKRAGYKNGCPDVLLFEPRGEWKGLFIELKKPADKLHGLDKGRTNPEQKLFLRMAEERGFCAKVCWGANEAIACIDHYLQMAKPVAEAA